MPWIVRLLWQAFPVFSLCYLLHVSYKSEPSFILRDSGCSGDKPGSGASLPASAYWPQALCEDPSSAIQLSWGISNLKHKHAKRLEQFPECSKQALSTVSAGLIEAGPCNGWGHGLYSQAAWLGILTLPLISGQTFSKTQLFCASVFWG